MDIIKSYTYAIEYVKNPSEELQLAAVESNSYAICYIEAPTELVQITAVNGSGRASRFEKNNIIYYSENDQGNAIRYIKSPCVAALLAAFDLMTPDERRTQYIRKLNKIQHLRKTIDGLSSN